jgi:CelD/BcsL family acetyltransferase involved in cellulose biosynthesis
VRVERVDPLTDSRWRRLAAGPKGSLFSSPPWLEVLAGCYGFDVAAVVGGDHPDEPSSGLCWCHVHDTFGERIVSLPFSDYCDPIVGGDGHWDGLVGDLVKSELPVTVRCLREHAPLRDERFPVRHHARWHEIALGADLEAVAGRFEDSARRAVRKAQKSGIRVEVAQDERDLRRFFDLHVQVRKRKYGLLPQPYRFFEGIWRRFVDPGMGRLLLAVHGATVAAATIYLEWGGRIYYKFNASDPAYLDRRPNDLLVWEGVQHGIAARCSAFDFGLSDADQEGLLRFKRKFATEEGDIVFAASAPAGGANGGRSPSLRPAFASLTRYLASEAVPDEVTKDAGEVLYGFLA